MPTVAAFLPRALLFPRPRPPSPPPLPPPLSTVVARRQFHHFPFPRLRLTKPRPLVIVASSSSSGASFDELDSVGRSDNLSSKESILLNMVQEIEPLDVSLIQKDVPAKTVDAMKRTISGMLGLLPSDQFHVLVEALWEPLFKLLISSMKTGYTLRSAEYRLYLERNLDIHDEHSEKGKKDPVEDDSPEMLFGSSPTISSAPGRNDAYCNHEKNDETSHENVGIDILGELSPEVQEYICSLQSRLNSAEKVAELSEPTCPGVEETIHSVVHGLLATLSPKVHSKPPHHMENPTGGTLGVGKDDCAELVENTSIQFQPLISVPRDYLARLLFWCMLLGHYIRGLEYRLELMELLTISSEVETVPREGDSLA
ncbi:uncharacterized protein LOC103999146 isoform X2 [Musa acuminata AAA Group]|uniref:uncharacterized protein LOC103999146 isoform X2 n=1 Tax=Musa acuminata AAA Group TaxID=214697 RepID=UPI0031DE3070